MLAKLLIGLIGSDEIRTIVIRIRISPTKNVLILLVDVWAINLHWSQSIRDFWIKATKWWWSQMTTAILGFQDPKWLCLGNVMVHGNLLWIYSMSISAWLFHTYFSFIPSQHNPHNPRHPTFCRLGTTSLGVWLAQLKTEELGEKQHVAQVTRRMNFANVRRWTSAPEPVKTWYDCLDLKFRTDEVLIFICFHHMFQLSTIPNL